MRPHRGNHADADVTFTDVSVGAAVRDDRADEYLLLRGRRGDTRATV